MYFDRISAVKTVWCSQCRQNQKNHDKGQKIFMTPYCTEVGVTEASRRVMMASERTFGCRVLIL